MQVVCRHRKPIHEDLLSIIETNRFLYQFAAFRYAQTTGPIALIEKFF